MALARCEKKEPFNTELMLSVAPEVKVISAGRIPRACAIPCLAFSMASMAVQPGAWPLDGLANPVVK